MANEPKKWNNEIEYHNFCKTNGGNTDKTIYDQLRRERLEKEFAEYKALQRKNELEKKENEFNDALKKNQIELKRLAFLNSYEKKIRVLIACLKEDFRNKFTLRELFTLKSTLLNALENNLNVKSNSTTYIKYPEAEALYAIYRLHGYNLEEISYRDEKPTLEKIYKEKMNEENLISF